MHVTEQCSMRYGGPPEDISCTGDLQVCTRTMSVLRSWKDYAGGGVPGQLPVHEQRVCDQHGKGRAGCVPIRTSGEVHCSVPRPLMVFTKLSVFIMALSPRSLKISPNVTPGDFQGRNGD